MRFRTWLAMGVGATIGAGLTYLLDPDNGEKRRQEAAQLARQKAEEYDLDKRADYLAGQAKGAVVERTKQVTPDERDYDPKTLIRKVESEVLGHTSVHSGQVVVDADDEGTVTLRGEVGTQSLIDELVTKTRDVQGVNEVRNLLHLPGEPTPGTPMTTSTTGNGRV